MKYKEIEIKEIRKKYINIISIFVKISILIIGFVAFALMLINGTKNAKADTIYLANVYEYNFNLQVDLLEDVGNYTITDSKGYLMRFKFKSSDDIDNESSMIQLKDGFTIKIDFRQTITSMVMIRLYPLTNTAQTGNGAVTFAYSLNGNRYILALGALYVRDVPIFNNGFIVTPYEIESITGSKIQVGNTFDTSLTSYKFFKAVTLSNSIELIPDTIKYSEGYDEGYKKGKEEGLQANNAKAYQEGYDKGREDYDSQPLFRELIITLGEYPINLFKTIFDFEIFGVNISAVVLSALSLLIVGYCIKKLL